MVIILDEAVDIPNSLHMRCRWWKFCSIS